MDSGSVITEWWLSGFQGVVALWGWAAVVLLYALWRSLRGSEPDTIRPSGPVD
jgi:hypothetical protein